MSDARRIRVLVADDHPVTRLGIAALVRTDARLVLVAECSSGREALDQFARERPDVSLVDLRMPEIDGWSVIAQMAKRDASACILAISAFDGPEGIRRAIEAGATAFADKGTSGADLLALIHRAFQRRHAQSAATRTQLASLPRTDPLTPRERDVLVQLVEGKTNQEIADALGIGVGTVRTHVASLFGKLGVDRRTEAAIAALRLGLV